MGHLLLSVEQPNLVQSVNTGRQAAVHAEDLQTLLRLVHRIYGFCEADRIGSAKDLSVDDGRETEVIEHFCAAAPNSRRAVLAQTLVIEPVDLGDLSRLVIPSDQHDPIRVANLKAKQI